MSDSQATGWNSIFIRPRLPQPLEHLLRPDLPLLLAHVRAMDEDDIGLLGMGNERETRREQENSEHLSHVAVYARQRHALPFYFRFISFSSRRRAAFALT